MCYKYIFLGVDSCFCYVSVESFKYLGIQLVNVYEEVGKISRGSLWKQIFMYEIKFETNSVNSKEGAK